MDAEEWTMPNDVLSWLNEVEESVKSLPDEVREGFSVTLDRIEMAREFHRKGLTNKLKRTCYRILRDLENARSDLDSHDAVKMRDRQSERAKKDRKDEDIEEIILELALMKINGDYLKAKDLWPLFFSKLDSEGYGPKLEKPAEKITEKQRYIWDGRPKGLKYTSFRNKIKEKRKENPQNSF
ncbi:hypothetical protein [Spongiibacter tropicus]|uniref:hypothetical protein n=2 Tax=Spongiibacter TaxID=630749 RepID=UPI00300832A0